MSTAGVIGCIMLVQLVAGITIGICSTKFGPKPYRVARNGAGKYVLQSYECVSPKWVALDGWDSRREWRKYAYVTVAEYGSLEEATEAYRLHMDGWRASEEAKREAESEKLAAERKKAHDEAIVKVYKMAD